MRILVYAGNLERGGAVQVALSFISTAIEAGQDHSWLFVVSPTLAAQLGCTRQDSRARFVTLQRRSGSLGRLFGARQLLRALEVEFRPHVVFTIFGPPYWTPAAPHLCGLGDSWLYSPHSIAWQRLSFRSRIVSKVQIAVKVRCLSPTWDYVVETEHARHELIAQLSFAPEKVHVVSNAPGRPFHDVPAVEARRRDAANATFRFLVLSADYPHKNLSLIPLVARELLDATRLPFEFVLTLPTDVWQRYAPRLEWLGVQNVVINKGVVRADECPALYTASDALFLPTLLEQFTATYPEAMIMRRPILTSDLDFAHSICGPAAEYFDPLDARAAATSCLRIMENDRLREHLVQLALERVKSFPTPEEKFCAYMKLLERIAGASGPGS